MPKRFKNGPILSISFIKKTLPRLVQNRLVAGSLVMFTGTMVANIGNYLYHLLIGRMLGPEGYGVLASVISIVYLLFILLNTLTLTTTKFVANLKGRKDLKGVRWLFDNLNRRLFVFSGFISLMIFLVSPLIASFLHLESVGPVLLIGLLFFISSFTSIARAILQGLLRFKQIVKSHIAETGSKVIIGVLLVWLGLSVNGAVLAFVMAGFVGYLVALFYLKPLKRYSPRKTGLNKKIFIKFALPVFLSNLSFTSLYTNDIILVKHYFSPHQAGLYAALAVLGKIIYFATGVIPMVMFPMIANRHSQGKDSRRLLLVALAMVFLIASGGVIIYFLFPKLMILTLFGTKYLSAVPLLVWMALFITIYSLSFLLTNFFLSIDKTKVVFLPVAAALAQVIFIHFFHHSLLAVIRVSIIICGLLLFGLMLYYAYGQKKGAFRYHSRL